jgi:FMN phosphatase YigB (HAD superfamily)
MRAALFLDFDGVILRNHPAHKSIANTCTSYVKKYVPFYNPLKAQELNRNLYTSYGHTLTGLKALKTSANIKEFNTLVYDTFPYTSFFNDIKHTHSKDIASVQKVLTFCDKHNIPVNIFSNSPDIWCYTILQLMGLPQLKTTSTICEDLLKPDVACFKNIEKQFPE